MAATAYHAASYLLSCSLHTFLPPMLPLFCSAVVTSKCGETSVTMPTPDKAGCSQGGLNYAIYGTTGKPLLAIHGLGASMYSWREFVKRQDTFPGYQIILIDLKGAGNSVRPHDENYSILTQRDLVYQLIAELKLTDLTIVGNSYGGAVSLLVSLQLIEEKPGLLKKLILIDSGGYNKLLPWYLKLMRIPLLGWLALHLLSARHSAKTVLKDSYYNHDLITNEQIDAYAAPIAAPGGRHALLQIAKGAIPKDIDELIKKYPSINVSTRILWGRDDKVIPLLIGKMLNEAIPGSSLDLIDQCGHIPQEEKPAETIRWMREFLGLPT
jgi:pimeloyl-ACP methyl ester carboxylesterase